MAALELLMEMAGEAEESAEGVVQAKSVLVGAQVLVGVLVGVIAVGCEGWWLGGFGGSDCCRVHEG